MSLRHFIVATAGHVDHGKSSLVRALTGTDPDRLPEEKARGITIDLGFAHLPIEAPGGSCSVGIVDVPGHEDFVKNMVAGMGAVDCALLVVAADDGWMPQTEEHLQILEYLGVRRGVVAITKADLHDADVALAAEDVRERLEGSALSAAELVPVSSVTRAGFPELLGALARVLDALPPRSSADRPRLAVDRVFTVRGMGTVVTGTLAGGALRTGEPVVLQPAGRTLRIRSLQSHNREVSQAMPGTRTALGLSEVSCDDVHRGDQLVHAGMGAASDIVEVLLVRSPRLPPRTRVLNTNTRVQVHQGSGSHPARLVLLQSAKLGPGETALAQLRFEHPVYMLAGDRFVVRNQSQSATLAGGLVLEPAGVRRGCREPARLRCLDRCAQSPEDPAQWVAAILDRDGAAHRSQLLRQSLFSDAAVKGAVECLVAGGRVRPLGDWWADALRLQALAQAVAGAVDEYHGLHPDEAGLDVRRVRELMGRHFAAMELAEPFLEDFCRDGGFRRQGTVLARSSHRPTLPADLMAPAQSCRDQLLARPLEPPARKDLESNPAAIRALRFLLETGEAVDVGADLVMSAEAFAEASRRVGAFLAAHGPAKASDLREALGTSRRVIIPLLERLDRDRVTERVGELRRLAAAR